MNVTIFNCDDYKAFSLDKEYESLCEFYYPDNRVDELAVNLCFIAPQSWLSKAQPAYQLVNLHPDKNPEIVCGKLREKVEIEVSSQFKQAVLKLFLAWQRKFCHWIHQHLSSRTVNGEKITGMTHLQQLIGQLVEHFNLLDGLLQGRANSLQAAADLCRSNGELLMKLPGGRAFLAGSVLELVWTYEVFYNVYFYC